MSDTLAIDSATVRLFRIPPATAMEDATHVVTRIEFILVELTSGDSKATGLGYTAGVGGTATAALLRDDCLPHLIGRDARDIGAIWQNLRDHLYRTGFGAVTTLALAAIDTALWELNGLADGQPLWQRAGAATPGIPAYASLIDLRPPGTLGEHLATLRAEGYDWFKIKVGLPNLDDDLARLAAAREAIGPDAKLSVDANMGLDLEEAVRRARAFAPFNLAWFEEPLPAEDILGHASLRAQTGIPVAVGESLYTPDEIALYLRAEAVDIVQADIARIGGITPWLRTADLAHAAGLPIAPHYMAEWAVHLLPAIPNGLVLENVLGAGLADVGLAAPGYRIETGRALPPDGAGHGIRFRLTENTAHEIPLGPLLITPERSHK
ncbi:mandelate racemase/muconate lactonizing enzyme family protein [Pseudoruegeria sp. HB172150]|uniref:mandelate racemase/muconate lactonizing enzyme family protein n=1 Tax=Pseudoruegeria sp. HB172150 TaxID=2721164 RepID=UPI001C130B42|nr:mandelate racemase/muconate lactonizing enzyme family protein [Pseudoruegeria sp. HB172150]